MAEMIQQYTQQFQDENGMAYTVKAHGQMTADSNWEGWLEFHPVDGTSAVLRTERETTQPDRAALEYWASGLESLYFEGAFARARIK